MVVCVSVLSVFAYVCVLVCEFAYSRPMEVCVGACRCVCRCVHVCVHVCVTIDLNTA